MMAATLGYPAEAVRGDPDLGLVRLSRRQAVHVLAVAGTTGLAYGIWRPEKRWLEEGVFALRDLGGDATFVSNGL